MHADVDVDRAVAAEPRELAVLQDVQQLGLQRRRHLADLVEHDRAVLRELELADARSAGAGEGAALVAEQLALEQVGRQRRAVDLDERLRCGARDRRCSSRAMTSLPTPLSPRSSTLTSLSATRSTIAITGCIAAPGAPARLRALGILGELRAEPRHFGAQRLALERVADRGFERRLADASGSPGFST